MSKISKVIGCGGVGKGLLFHSAVNETLGRSESRLVTLSNARDYCKQQIVFYYIAELLKGRVQIYPIGAVGDDSLGEELLSQMEAQGMNMSCMKKTNSSPTMLSICLQYPDKEGCNFTAENSAAGEVTPEFIEESLMRIGVDENTCLVAVPEVRIDSRVRMLELGKKAGAFCVLSVPASEAKEFETRNTYAFCDLIAVNEEEARAVTGSLKCGRALAQELLLYLQSRQPSISVVMTMGKEGAYCGRETSLEFVPAFPAKTVNTTGAGDAFLGALVSGLLLDLPFLKKAEGVLTGETVLYTAPELAAVCAGMAVENEDSIAENVTRGSIEERIEKQGWRQEFFTEKEKKG